MIGNLDDELGDKAFFRGEALGFVAEIWHVWFMANYVTHCLMLVIRIEELNLGTKVSQSMTS